MAKPSPVIVAVTTTVDHVYVASSPAPFPKGSVLRLPLEQAAHLITENHATSDEYDALMKQAQADKEAADAAAAHAAQEQADAAAAARAAEDHAKADLEAAQAQLAHAQQEAAEAAAEHTGT